MFRKLKSRKIFWPGAHKFRKKLAGKLKVFRWEKAELSMRWKDRPNNTFDQGLSLKAKKQPIRDKSCLDGPLFVSLEWNMNGEFVRRRV